MWSKRLIGNLFEEESEEGNGGGEKNGGETNGLTSEFINEYMFRNVVHCRTMEEVHARRRNNEDYGF